MQLENMYQEIILDHYRNPHGRGLREPFEAEVHHVNPTCGDEVTLRVHLDGDTIADVSYEGMGCSISQASVSAMYDLVIGKTVPQALETGEHFMTLMQAKGDPVGRREARGRTGGRRGVRRCVEVPRAHQVRADELDGPQGRQRPSSIGRPHRPDRRHSSMSETTETTDETPAELPAYKSALLEDLEEAMRDVVDPELGVNVVDLGLVYGIDVDESNVAILDMTLTSAACPLTDVIEDQARQALTGGPGPGLVDDIRINWVWMPPWGPDKITDDGREQLRALGFRV